MSSAAVTVRPDIEIPVLGRQNVTPTQGGDADDDVRQLQDKVAQLKRLEAETLGEFVQEPDEALLPEGEAQQP